MNKTNQIKVTSQELLQEITVCVRDEIVAQYQQQGDKLTITLGNGQKFCLTVQEI